MTKVLVIDDERVIASLMTEILGDAGYETATANDADEALRLIADEDFDVVVSDIVMPRLTGLELLEHVRAQRPSLPVIMVTGSGTHGNLTEALARGAAGLVAKPFSHQQLLDAVATVLQRADRAQAESRTRVLTPTLATALANAIEARETSLHGHCERLATLAGIVAEELGLSRDEADAVRLGAVLHDVGKIGIPDRILLKPGPLDAEERRIIESHTVIGDRLLEPLELLDSVRPIVRHHHERWDGDGYPDGLGGDGIPLSARIVAVADSVEAMSAHRPYREPLPVEDVVAELERGRGTQWDPSVVDIVLDLVARGVVRVGPEGLAVSSSDGTAGPLASELPEGALRFSRGDAGAEAAR